jgi:hypothetical protein
VKIIVLNSAHIFTQAARMNLHTRDGFAATGDNGCVVLPMKICTVNDALSPDGLAWIK